MNRRMKSRARADTLPRVKQTSLCMCVCLLFVACTRDVIQEEKRGFWLLTPSATKTADAEEVRRSRKAGGWQIQRLWHDPQRPTDKERNSLENFLLDDDGVLEQGSYRNETAHGRLYVEFKQNDAGQWMLESRGDGEQRIIDVSQAPPVAFSALEHVKRRGPVTVIDFVHAQSVVVHDVRLVPLQWTPETSDTPAARPWPTTMLQPSTAPHVRDAVRSEHKQPAPFLESASPKVVSFAKQTAPSLPPLEAARVLVATSAPRIDTARAGPPSAINTVMHGGGRDGQLCLVVAALRALGHAARVVAGIDLAAQQGINWAEVHDGVQWQVVEGMDVPTERLALAEGLYSPILLALLQEPPR
jgi:hypothetical protein